MIVYTYLTGRGRTGSDAMGTLIHAVEGAETWPSFGPALCGAKPGRMSNGWSGYHGDKPTCPKCIKKLAAAQAQ